MENNPLVSILVPVYNVQEFLTECLDSLVFQSYKNLQIVLLDDGSIDNSLKICRDYAMNDFRVEVYLQENQGVAATRNSLLGKAKGDYVLFVDSDDWVEPEMVESLVNLAEIYNADIVTCKNVINYSVCQKDSIKIDTWSQEETIYHFLRHIILNGSLWNKLIRTKLLSGLKFHPEISFGEDALFCWQVLQRVRKVVQTSAQYYHYRMNNNSISHSIWKPETKGSNHMVWERIKIDTKLSWPKYIDVVIVRTALEDMWALYYASASRYKYDIHIEVRQQNIRRNIWKILKSDIPSLNMKLYAVIASISYCVLKYIHK